MRKKRTAQHVSIAIVSPEPSMTPWPLYISRGEWAG